MRFDIRHAASPAAPTRMRAADAWAVLAFLVFLTAASSGVALAPGDMLMWRFDPARSDIRFELAALGLIPVRGTFERFGGRVWRDAEDGLLRVEIRIDAESLAMDSERYRDWARSSEFFHVRRYPEIVFRSDAISDALLAHGGELSGHLDLRGIERDARFEIAANQCASRTAACELWVTGEIDRRQFGMRSRRMTLSSRVHLDMHFRAVPEQAPIGPMPTLD